MEDNRVKCSECPCCEELKDGLYCHYYNRIVETNETCQERK